jgi:hypothetical protein
MLTIILVVLTIVVVGRGVVKGRRKDEDWDD